MCKLVLMFAALVLVACVPTSVTVSLGTPPTATPTEVPTSLPTATATSAPNLAATPQVQASVTAQAQATATAAAQTQATATAQAQATATAAAQTQATATAQAQATAAAQTQATATAQAQATTAAQAQATTTAQAQATTAAQARATTTAQAQATATAQAQANATATAQAAVAATKNALVAFVDALVQKADKPLRFPDGQLTSSKALNTEFYPENFVADIEFTNPADPKVHSWDLMFYFRMSSVENRLILVLYSNGTWALLYPGERQADRTMTVRVSQGTMPTLNVSATGSNKVRLLVYKNAGVLFVNGELAGTMDTSKVLSSGALYIVTGMMIGDDFPGLVVPYKNLVISGIQ